MKMLKKSLIALAILAIAVPAFAGDYSDNKYHKPWEQTNPVYVAKTVTTIDVIMDVGYWIEIYTKDSIEVYQDSSIGDAFYNYSGCSGDLDVNSNFNATLTVSAEADTSTATGDWSATIGLDSSDQGSSIGITGNSANTVVICVVGKDLNLEGLPRTDNLKVATVTIKVVPAS
jgi:hypothetical protein